MFHWFSVIFFDLSLCFIDFVLICIYVLLIFICFQWCLLIFIDLYWSSKCVIIFKDCRTEGRKSLQGFLKELRRGKAQEAYRGLSQKLTTYITNTDTNANEYTIPNTICIYVYIIYLTMYVCMHACMYVFYIYTH